MTLGDLDPSDALYPIALQCNFSHGAACDTLYDEAEAGSDFETFADTCGETQPAGSGDQCAELSGGFDNGDGFTLPDNNGGGSFGTTPPFGDVGAGSSDKSLEIGLVSLLFGIAYVGALLVFDRRRWHGLGTALVIPGFLALFTGTEVLGNAAHHLWFGGVLTFVAGVAFALVGDFGGRRFSAWAGAALAAFGAYTFAGDATDFQKSFDDINPHLVRPALITIGFGIALVALAWVHRVRAIEFLRHRRLGAAGTDARTAADSAGTVVRDAGAAAQSAVATASVIATLGRFADLEGRDHLGHQLARGSGVRRNAHAGVFEHGHLRLRGSLRAGDDRARVAHLLAGWRRDAGDVAHDRLRHPRLDELRGLFLGRPADLAEHDHGLGLRVGFEQLETVDEARTGNRVTADADARGDAEPEVRELVERLVGERARTADDADRTTRAATSAGMKPMLHSPGVSRPGQLGPRIRDAGKSRFTRL